MADVEYNIKFNVDASDAADGFDDVREAANESFQKLLKMFDELNKATEEFNKIDLNALSDDQELLDSATAMSELANKTREVQGAFAEWQNTISQLDSDADVEIINQMYDYFDSLGHPLADAEDSITAMIEKLKELNHETESFYDDEDGAPLLDEAELQKSLDIIEDGYAEIGASTENVMAAEERQRAAFQAAYEEYAKTQEKEEAAAEALAKRAQKESAAKEAKEQAEAAKAAAKHQEEVKKKIEATINAAKKLANIMKSVGSAILSAAKQAGKLALSLAKGPSLGSGMLKKALGVAGIVGIGALFKQASSAANDLTDSVGMVNAAFGENSKSMHDWADNQAIYYNVSRLSAEKYFGELGEYLKNANVDTDAAATIAKNMVAKAGEVGRAYAGMSSDQAMNIMQNVLAGGRVKQQGSKIGLKLDDDAYQAELLAEGINAVYKDLSASEQMIIRYNTVMRQLGDTTGSTADGFMSWEGAVANLTANVKDALSSFGLIIQHYLLPVVQLLNTVMAAVADALRGLLGTLGIDLPQASTAAASAIEGVGDAATDAGKNASTGLAGFDKLNNLSESKGKGAGGLNAKAVSGTIKPLDQLTDKLGDAKTKLQELLDKIKKLDYKALGKKIAQMFNNGVTKLKTWLKKLGQFDVGTKLGDIFNGFLGDFDANSLGDLLGTAFGNMQTTITNFLSTLEADKLGERIADLIIGFDLPTNLGKLGTNVGLLITKIAQTINSMLGGEKGDEVRQNIKDGIINALQNAITNIDADEVGQAIGNLAKTIGTAMSALAKGMRGLGTKLGETMNSAIESGGVSELAQGFSELVLSALVECINFITTTDWLSLAGEILKGVGTALEETIKSDPGVLLKGVGLWLTWEGVKHLFTGLKTVGTGIGGEIAGGISKTTAAGGVLAVAVAGVTAIISDGISQLKEYINSIQEIEESRQAIEDAVTSYKGQVREGAMDVSYEDEIKAVNEAVTGYSDAVTKFNDAKSKIDSRITGDVLKKDIPDMNAVRDSLQQMAEAAERAGQSGPALDSLYSAIKEFDKVDLSEGIGLGLVTGSSQTELNEGWGKLEKAVAAAVKVSKDMNETAIKYDEVGGKAADAAETLAEKEEKLSNKEVADFMKKFTTEELTNFGNKLESVNKEQLSPFLEQAGKLLQLKWDGQLVDNSALQSNLDIAVGKVQKAAKDIDDAIANSTNLRNFEATLSSTQTIKVDSSGTMNFKFDVTTKPDKDAFNSWQEKYTKANKALNG